MINTLFSELDQTLQNDGRLEHLDPREHPYHSQQRNPISKTPFPGDWDQHDYENAVFRDDPLYEVDFDPFEEFHEPPHQQSSPFWTRHLDKIIFFSSCSLFMGSLLLIEDNHQFSLASLQEIQTAIVDSDRETPRIIDSNSEFLSYMERALIEIDQEKALAEKVKAQQTPQSSQKSVTPIIPQSQPKAQSTPSVQPQKSQSVAALPALPPPPPALQNAQPPAPTPKPSPQPKPASTAPTETNPVPSTAKKESPPESQPETTTMIPTTSSHTLVGLLELGEHSAALLKVDGATQRIMLEERIPGSNWKLVSVANQQATFTNNEQQKVMFVGEAMSVQ
ncbi:MAG: hypothetical protein RI580_16965 [Halothece sp. Uz-M2-17]|nr:hypothetical protein [Halothece sp. Uz-M2-17]